MYLWCIFIRCCVFVTEQQTNKYGRLVGISQEPGKRASSIHDIYGLLCNHKWHQSDFKVAVTMTHKAIKSGIRITSKWLKSNSYHAKQAGCYKWHSGCNCFNFFSYQFVSVDPSLKALFYETSFKEAMASGKLVWSDLLCGMQNQKNSVNLISSRLACPWEKQSKTKHRVVKRGGERIPLTLKVTKEELRFWISKQWMNRICVC